MHFDTKFDDFDSMRIPVVCYICYKYQIAVWLIKITLLFDILQFHDNSLVFWQLSGAYNPVIKRHS